MVKFTEFINENTLTSRLAKMSIVLSGVLILFLITNSILGKIIFENTIVSVILFLILTIALLRIKKTEKVKIGASFFIISYFVVFLPIFFSFQTFNLISAIKPQIFYNYATQGQYEKEIVFTNENLNNNGLNDTILEICKENGISIYRLKTKQSIYNVLSKNPGVTKNLLDKNESFQKYLITINWQTDDVIKYVDRLYSLDGIIFKGSIYISILLMLLFCLFKINFRAELYFIAGIVYTISILGQITNDFSAVIIFKNFSYNELSEITSSINIIKEAFLTFIIFDTLIQLINDKKSCSKSSNLISKTKDNLSNNCSEDKNIKVLDFIVFCFRKHFIVAVIAVLLLPIFFMSLLAFFMKLGCMIIGTRELIIDFNKEIDIGNYIYWYSCFLVIEVTAIFSYVLWKSSEKSNYLSEQIKKREDNKDNEVVRENALIVYFDLLIGLDDLRKLYVYHVLGKKKYYKNPPQDLFFSKEWIKNVAVLKNKLSINDIRTIYDLYGKLFSIKRLLIEMEKNKDLLKNDIKELFLEVFENRVPGVLNYFYIEDIRKIMKSEYLILLNTIEVLTCNNINNESKNDIVILSNQYYEGNLQSGVFLGDGKYFNINGNEVKNNKGMISKKTENVKNGKVTFDGEFNSNKFITGSRTEYYDNGQLWYHCFIEKSKLKEDDIILYENNMEIYRGAVQEGKYLTGKGMLHLKELDENDKLRYYLFGKREYQYLEPVFVYEGEFKNGNFHGNGKITYTKELCNENLRENNELLKENIVLCKGEFQDNYLINGYGKIIEKDKSGIFEGRWVDGEIQNGIYRYFDGLSYIEKITRLKFKDESMNSKELTPSNKASLGFINFKGIGTIYSSKDLIHYKGEVKGFDFDGKGTEFFISDKNQIKYDGYFEKSQYHGRGIEYYDNEKHSIKFEGIFENGKCKSGKQYNENDDLMFDGDFEGCKFKNGLVYRAAGFKVTTYVSGVSLEECTCEGEFKDFKPLDGCLVIDKNNNEIGILKELNNLKYTIDFYENQ